MTVVSKASGQWWSARSSGGSVSFSGLYPGRYTITVPGAGVWFGRSGPVAGGQVRPGKVAFGSFRLTQRGGWVTGQAVDAGAPAYPIANAQVQLYDVSGRKVAETTSGSSGWFTLAGPLATQGGLTVVVNPGPGGGGWTTGERWCHFASSSVHGVQVTQGQQTSVDQVPVARTSADCSS